MIIRISTITILFLTGLAFSVAAQDSEPPATTLDATSIKLKLYKFAVSANADCTNATTVFESAVGIESDMLTSPTFGKGKIPSGTYRCIMIEVSKLMNTAAGGTCTTPKNNLLCADAQQSKLVDGSNVTCSGGTSNDQKVVLYFTTLSAGNTGTRALLPPTNSSDTTSGMVLSNPIVFPTNKKAILRIVKQMISSVNCNSATPTISISVP